MMGSSQNNLQEVLKNNTQKSFLFYVVRGFNNLIYNMRNLIILIVLAIVVGIVMYFLMGFILDLIPPNDM